MLNLVVLIVDDHPSLRVTLTEFIERMPRVRVLSTGEFGRAAAWIESEKRVDLLLSNVWLRGDLNGLHVAELALTAHPRIAIVMMSSTDRNEIRGLPSNHVFIQKPLVRKDS